MAWTGSITRPIEIFSLPSSSTSQQGISTRPSPLIPTASAYKTMLLLVLSIIIVLKGRRFFFNRTLVWFLFIHPKILILWFKKNTTNHSHTFSFIHIWLFPLEIIADTYLRSAASYSLFISPFSINDFREVVRILCSKFSFGFEIFLRWEFFGCIRATRNCGRYCGTCAVHFYWKVMSSCQCRSFLTLQCVRMSFTIHSASKVREVM